jgi:hypothetical protein
VNPAASGWQPFGSDSLARKNGARRYQAGDVPAVEVPEDRRAERRLVERDRRVAVADGQHGEI